MHESWKPRICLVLVDSTGNECGKTKRGADILIVYCTLLLTGGQTIHSFIIFRRWFVLSGLLGHYLIYLREVCKWQEIYCVEERREMIRLA